MPGLVKQIAAIAIKILKANPQGIHYTDLVRRTQSERPDFKEGTVFGTVYALPIEYPQEVYKPTRGLYRHTDFRGIPEPPVGPKLPGERFAEEAFYTPFANWLVQESEECTKAIPLGGNKFKDKWGTPDVIGILESRKGDLIEFDTEVVSAEIKTNTQDLITAFGQACAYKLFSHKSYIVVPKNASDEDLDKIDSLCLIFGIGLVLFDNADAQNPRFEIRVRPSKHDPDMFYANRAMQLVRNELFP